MKKVAVIEVHENGHIFWPLSALGISTLGDVLACKECGAIRRRDGKNKECRGRIAVELRKESAIECAHGACEQQN